VSRALWAVMVSCTCWAQTVVTMPDQRNGKSDDGLTGDGFVHGCTLGKGQFQPVCSVDPYTTVPPDQPHEQFIGQPISVRQLRHKVPKEAAREFQRAIKLSRAGEHEKAAAALEAAVGRDPELSSAEDRLGVEYTYLGRWGEAETAFRRTVDLEPAWWMGHFNLALVLYAKGDLPGAEQSLRRALVVSSDNPKIHLILGKMLVMREETRAEGITELRFAARTMPDAKQALRDLGTQ
jgi:tetratricopeptide (TPR) repeat protein